jgi:protein phosphatase
MAETVVSPPALEIASRTHPGRDPDKQINEDASTHLITPLGQLCIVCDGMGGHVGGRDASNLAVKTIVEYIQRATPGIKPGQALRDAIAEANKRVRGLPGDDATGRPGSTVVALLIHPRGTEVAHVGDSRCYYVHAAQISQITKDHSMVQEMVDRGLLTPEEAKGHPEANKITRALGMDPTVGVDLRPDPVAHVAGDAFILCTDGLSDLVEPDDILRTVSSAPPAQAAGQLVELANARGGYDNITVLVVRVKESAIPGARPLAPTVNQSKPPLGPSAAFGGPQAAAQPKTQVASPAAGRTEPPPPGSVAPESTARRRGRIPLVVGVILAVMGVGVAITLLVLELGGRGGAKRQTVPWGEEPIQRAQHSDAAVLLEPQPPPPTAVPEIPTNDLPPLTPATSATPRGNKP